MLIKICSTVKTTYNASIVISIVNMRNTFASSTFMPHWNDNEHNYWAFIHSTYYAWLHQPHTTISLHTLSLKVGIVPSHSCKKKEGCFKHKVIKGETNILHTVKNELNHFINNTYIHRAVSNWETWIIHQQHLHWAIERHSVSIPSWSSHIISICTEVTISRNSNLPLVNSISV